MYAVHSESRVGRKGTRLLPTPKRRTRLEFYKVSVLDFIGASNTDPRFTFGFQTSAIFLLTRSKYQKN